MKLVHLLFSFLLVMHCAMAQIRPERQDTRPYQHPMISRPLTIPSGLTQSQTITPSFYKQKGNWQRIIDSTWGPGMPLNEKLALFNTFASSLTERFDGILSLGLNWDSLISHYRAKIDSATSRGRFAAIMGKFAWSLRDVHTYAIDSVVEIAPPIPGVPVLNLFPFASAERFGAVLTVLPDSSALVLRTVANHPLGLHPGDIVLGYEGVPWKQLVHELMNAELPLFAIGSGARSAEMHTLLRAVGNNWHLFDTIDIVKYSTKKVQHFPVAPLLTLPSVPIFASEQLPIPGIPSAYCLVDPRDLYSANASRQPVAYGTIPGTDVGYIQLVVHYPEALADVQLANAVAALWNKKGLIIDMRWDIGGGALLNTAFSMLFSQRVTTIENAVRSGPRVWTLMPTGNRIEYVIPGKSGSLFDRPLAVLLGPACVSSGDVAAQRLRYHPMVRFFGKSPIASIGWGSSLNGYGDYIMSYSTADAFHVSKPGVFLSRSEFPIDEPVWFNADDVAQGKDPVVESAFAWMTSLAYAHDIRLTQPCMDTIRITARVENPLKHEVAVTAFLKDASGTLIDSLILKDDGVHADSAAGDGIWGCTDTPAKDVVIYASVRTDDLTAATSRLLPDVAMMIFTRRSLISVDKRVIQLGRISQTAGRCDTSFVVLNKGWTADTLTVNLDPGNIVPDSAISVSPKLFTLAPGDSQTVVVSIRLDLLPPADYFSGVYMESKTGIPQTVFEMYVYFEIVKSTSISDIAKHPTVFRLEQNYPNPFNPTTAVSYQLPHASRVTLRVFDVLGLEVATLVNEMQQPGTYFARWDASGVPSGVYFYRLQAGEFVSTKRMLMLK
jgi:hypothetical protein